MALSGQRKASLLVLALAVGAWGVDRFVLSSGLTSPASASAASAQPSASAGGSDVAAEKPAAPVTAEQLAMARLSRQLRELGSHSESELAELTEAFVPPEPPAAPAAAPEPVVAVEAPQVTAVLIGAKPSAIVNGRTVPLAGEVDGWVIASIGREGVVFSRDGRRVERTVR
jgi:hypothetical protein